jgi:RHS repeat-associated protein
LTDFGYTGQRKETGFDLHDYNARFYSSRLGRFISPDSIVPEPRNPQAWNRYSYTINNPLKYVDPSGHDFSVTNFQREIFDVGGGGGKGGSAAGGAGLVVLLYAAATALQNLAPQAVQAVQTVGPQFPAVWEKITHSVQNTNDGRKQSADKSGDANNPDPNDFFRGFRNTAEKYQYQTSGTRFGGETRLNVQVRGIDRTIDVDGIVNGYLHEAKYLDSGSSFYSKILGKLGSGLKIHVQGWEDEMERLSLAARQHGYGGVKVFTNNQDAIRVAKELYKGKEWFTNIQFIFEKVR